LTILTIGGLLFVDITLDPYTYSVKLEVRFLVVGAQVNTRVYTSYGINLHSLIGLAWGTNFGGCVNDTSVRTWVTFTLELPVIVIHLSLTLNYIGIIFAFLRITITIVRISYLSSSGGVQYSLSVISLHEVWASHASFGSETSNSWK
jgi:hypothetical protein